MITSKIKELLQSIQTQYYDLLDAFYGDFYEQYCKSGMSVSDFLHEFLSTDKLNHIRISEGKLLFENQLAEQMLNFKSVITSFWPKHIQKVKTLLSECGNVGYFGTTENNSTQKYENTIKQNAVFFDLVALNDPFCEAHPLDTQLVSHSGVSYLFFESLISVFSIRPYVLNNEDLIAVIIPMNAIIQYDEQCTLMDKAHDTALDIAKQLFDIDYKEGDYVQCIRALKKYTDIEISEILYRNGIYINLSEAQNYERYALGVDGREQLINLSRGRDGQANWDFVRCALNYGAIPNILTTIFAVHAIHSEAAIRTNMHPIFNAFEWYPNKYYYERIPGAVGVTDEYKYVCAIQRNHKLAQLVQMDMHNLLKFREKNESCKFRQLFHTATSDIITTPDHFSEIAESVFSNLKETLNRMETEKAQQHKDKLVSSWFGLGKAVGGFVPVVSHALGAYDVGKSVHQIYKEVSREDDVIDYLVNSSSNILTSKNSI